MTSYAAPAFDPVELARAELGQSLRLIRPGITDEPLRDRLNRRATELGFLTGRYYVETDQALVVPKVIEPDDDNKVTLGNLPDIAFGGVLTEYSKLLLSRRVGGWCLVFGKSTLLPILTEIDDEHELFVPVLAVRTINQLPETRPL